MRDALVCDMGVGHQGSKHGHQLPSHIVGHTSLLSSLMSLGKAIVAVHTSSHPGMQTRHMMELPVSLRVDKAFDFTPVLAM